MIPDNVKNVITKLINKTKSNDTIWNKSSASNGYKIDLNSAVISVSAWEDYNQNKSFSLSILNDRGQAIESITCEERDSDFELLENLYNTVNRSYLKVDETLKNLIDEIDSKPTIGVEEKPKSNNSIQNAIDDLPF